MLRFGGPLLREVPWHALVWGPPSSRRPLGKLWFGVWEGREREGSNPHLIITYKEYNIAYNTPIFVIFSFFFTFIIENFFFFGQMGPP